MAGTRRSQEMMRRQVQEVCSATDEYNLRVLLAKTRRQRRKGTSWKKTPSHQASCLGFQRLPLKTNAAWKAVAV